MGCGRGCEPCCGDEFGLNDPAFGLEPKRADVRAALRVLADPAGPVLGYGEFRRALAVDAERVAGYLLDRVLGAVDPR